MSCAQCKINVPGFKKEVRRKWDTPMYYSDLMDVHVLITKGQCNTSCNFAFHYKSDEVKKNLRKLILIFHHYSF